MRWHAPTCHQPDVHVAEDGFPACRRCGKSAHGMRHLRDDLHSSLGPLPPDEPERRLNLWWPQSVPYTSIDSPTGIDYSAKGSTDRFPPFGVKSDVREASVEPLISPASHENALHIYEGPLNGHIYERPLKPREFRLACLSALPDRSDRAYPVHLSFDVVEIDHYPDYDTVSYAWGGEDNNRDHNSLIYVGDYWDVLYATRNCWAVLRYLHPWRGTRLVWLDFICINQRDSWEKAQQISRMGQIYSNCNQVFLWLGEDAVSHDQAALPSRRPLKDLQGLHQILSRNYFTRVWVIQELVLSPRISMPCGDTVFEVYPQSLENMENTLAESPAPWLNLATRGSSHNHSWAEVMRMTSQSESSDARDGLYGVLGLWASGGSLPLPSYEISYQHMMIGMFAWLLIHGHDLDVLLAAKCISFADYGDTAPSWTPPWKKHNFWHWFIEVSSMNRMRHRIRTWDERSMWYDLGILRPAYGRPWQSQITVDHNTGGLSLVAIKIHEMQSDLQKDKDRKNELETATDPRDHVWSSGCGLHVQTCRDIEGIVKEADELYLLCPSTSGGQEEHKSPVYLFLRKVANQMHNLVLCVPMVYFNRCLVYESLEETRVDRSLAVDELNEIWHRPMYKFDEDMHTSGFLGRSLQRTFPGNESTPFHVLLAVILHKYDFQRLLDNDAARKLDAKIEANDKSLHERDEKAAPYLTFKFSKSEWQDIGFFYTVDKEKPNEDGMGFQCNRDAFTSEDWESIYITECWEIPERLRNAEEMHIQCKLIKVQQLLRRIDRELCITSIWRSMGIQNPKGSWEEFLCARALYPSITDSGDLKKNDQVGKYHGSGRVGNSAIMGLELRIHIV